MTMEDARITEEGLRRLHQTEWQWSRRQRFVLAEWELDPRRVLARQVEHLVRDILADRGYVVSGTRHKERFDLLAQGVRIEVKAARWDGEKYVCNMHGNSADVLVFACIDGEAHYFVIPFGEVAGLHMLKISQHDPRDYCGKWMRYYSAWDYIDELVSAGVNAWQPRLMVVEA